MKSGSDPEPAKSLLPYLQRADELQNHDPLVAYYCRFYAIELGLKLPARTKKTTELLNSIIKKLEKDKKTLKLGPDDNLHVEGFALNVFEKADKQDRAGRADLNTAKTYYASSIFFEILQQFGELPPDIEQKQRYAIWKAADIRKALNEGRVPNPGPPSGNDEFSGDEIEESSSWKPENTSIQNAQKSNGDSFPHPVSDEFGLPSVPDKHPQSFTSGYGSGSGPMYPSSSLPEVPPPASGSSSEPLYHYVGAPTAPYHYSGDAHSADNYPGFTPSYPTSGQGNSDSYVSLGGHIPDPSFNPNSVYSAPKYGSYLTNPTGDMPPPPSLIRQSSAPASETNIQTYQPPPDRISEAHKAARFAVSALAFDDVPTAVSHLTRSLELLTNPSASIH